MKAYNQKGPQTVQQIIRRKKSVLKREFSHLTAQQCQNASVRSVVATSVFLSFSAPACGIRNNTERAARLKQQ